MALFAVAPLAALPWLQGFFAPFASTDETSHDVVAELGEWRQLDEECTAGAYTGGMTLTADLAPSVPGVERVLASYTQGLVVLDHERHVIAEAAGFECEGSADELVAITAGDAAIDAPVVALAATMGGRGENITMLMLYRVSNGGELQPIFSGEVERHAEKTTRTGVVTLIPGGLVHQDPTGFTSLWIYEPEQGRYIQQLATRPNV